MKSVRFSKVVEKCGKPEVYLLMSETDPDFHKAVEAGKIMSLSDESHGSGSEYGTVGYDKKRHGQLLLFPKSLKSFAGAKIIGIKYDLLEEEQSEEKEVAPSRHKVSKKAKDAPKPKAASKPAAKAPKTKKAELKPVGKRSFLFRQKRKRRPTTRMTNSRVMFVRP